MKRITSVFAAAVAAACAGHAAPPSAPAPAAVRQPAPPPPAPLRYSTSTGRYQFQSQSHIEQEMMGQMNSADVTTGGALTVAVADTSGNLGVAITIDSLALTLPPGVPGPDSAALLSARGAMLRIVASPSGEPISFAAPDSSNLAVQQAAAALREFLPILPAGVPDSGSSWTDSTTQTIQAQGVPLTIRRTRQHLVLGWETHAGTRALHLATSSSYTVTGSGETQGQEIDFNGSGLESGDAYVSAAGVYLGGTVSDSSLVNANVVSVGMVIPVRRKTLFTLTRLP